MNTASNALRVGLFFILGVALLYVVYDALNARAQAVEGGYRVEAPFQDILQLKPSDDVRMAGVRIGTVAGMRLEDRKAIVELSIEGQYDIPADSVAQVEMAGLLGNNFVSIKPGDSTEDIAAGGTINTRETETLGQVIEEFGQVGEKVNKFLDDAGGLLGGGDGKKGGLFASVDKLVEENREKINQIVSNFNEVSGKLASDQGTLGKLINDDSAYDELMSVGDDIKQAAEGVNKVTGDAQDVFADIKSGKGALGVLLYDEKVAQQLRDTVANVDEFTES